MEEQARLVRLPLEAHFHSGHQRRSSITKGEAVQLLECAAPTLQVLSSGGQFIPEVPLTDFVDFAGKSDTSRMTAVRTIKQRPEYHPKPDYYRELRELAISNM